MLTLLLLLASSVPVSADDVSSTASARVDAAPTLPASPTDTLQRIDDAAAVLDHIRYGAVRTTEQSGHTTREVWRFASEEGGRFRIDYFGDTQRVVVCDGRTLTDYVPVRRSARAFILIKLSDEERSKLLGGVLAKITVPGVRTGWQAAGMTDWKWGEDGARQGRPTRTIVGTDTKGGRLSFVVDAERGNLLSNTLEDNGVFVFGTETFDHEEVSPGTWLPMRVLTTAPGPGGRVGVELRLNKVVVGEDVPDSLFELGLDPSVDVEHHP